jgi:hypothetical protein
MKKRKPAAAKPAFFGYEITDEDTTHIVDMANAIERVTDGQPIGCACVALAIALAGILDKAEPEQFANIMLEFDSKVAKYHIAARGKKRPAIEM